MKPLLILFALVAVIMMTPNLEGQAAPAKPVSPASLEGRTFLGAPYVPKLEELNADFAVVGIPSSEGSFGQPAERHGPRVLREMSYEYKHDITEGFYYIDGDRTALKGKRWADVGDVESAIRSQTNDKITATIRTILSKKAFPIVLGGDHSITFPILRAFDTPLTLIHFDAHLDSWNQTVDNLDNASWVNRASRLPTIKNIVQIGMRGLANHRDAAANAHKMHTTIITSEQIHRRGVQWALSQVPEGGDIYVTIDIDVMDPSVAPGTGAVEPGGLSFFELDDLLMGVASKGHLVGCDLVELNSWNDPSGRTAQTAVRALIDLLGAAIR